MKSEADFEKYLVRMPSYRTENGRKTEPIMTYLSSQLVNGARYYLELKWVGGKNSGTLWNQEYVSDFDEIVLLVGSHSEHPHTLGAELNFSLGRQNMQTANSTGIYIPRGVPFGPVTCLATTRPHLQISLRLGAGENQRRNVEGMPVEIPAETDLKKRGVDYEQYVIRSPIREAGAEFLRGRTAPTLTYMSGTQIPWVKCYIELGWTFDMPLSSHSGSGMPEMQHENFDEIVLHLGGDWEHPLELGGEIEFCVGGQPLCFNSTTALYLPRGLLHGPLRCLSYQKPHIVMAIMAGIGSLKEGWSAKNIPDNTR